MKGGNAHSATPSSQRPPSVAFRHFFFAASFRLSRPSEDDFTWFFFLFPFRSLCKGCGLLGHQRQDLLIYLSVGDTCTLQSISSMA
ncbi:hypothetical protein VTH06DRAFT_7907 [Thermothelomyces fergusii]